MWRIYRYGAFVIHSDILATRAVFAVLPMTAWFYRPIYIYIYIGCAKRPINNSQLFDLPNPLFIYCMYLWSACYVAKAAIRHLLDPYSRKMDGGVGHILISCMFFLVLDWPTVGSDVRMLLIKRTLKTEQHCFFFVFCSLRSILLFVGYWPRSMFARVFFTVVSKYRKFTDSGLHKGWSLDTHTQGRKQHSSRIECQQNAFPSFMCYSRCCLHIRIYVVMHAKI